MPTGSSYTRSGVANTVPPTTNAYYRNIDCYDNAALESWNHSLKVEAIPGERFVTREAAKARVFEYLEIYYNRKRPHSTLGYLSPEVFEAR